MGDLVCVRIVISGVVQGVGYRYFAMKKAKDCGFGGYVKNLYNGDVEVEVEGEKGLINDFIEELKVGPMSSQVTNVNVEWRDYQNRYNNFDVKF
jgi:acylphosphatase